MTVSSKIYVAGHRGMVGSAIIRILQQQDQTHINTRTHAELDLSNQAAVRSFFETENLDQVYLAAAKVGGIHANNTYPTEFIYQNMIIHQDMENGLFIGKIDGAGKAPMKWISGTTSPTSGLPRYANPTKIEKQVGDSTKGE